MNWKKSVFIAVCSLVFLVAIFRLGLQGDDEVPPDAAAAEVPPGAKNPSPFWNKPPPLSDANPQVASVAEAISDGKHPERLNALAAPPPFDADKHQADPQKYLDVIEPGRAFQRAKAGPGVPLLKLIDNAFQATVPGDTVMLRLRAPAIAPVTFHSTGGGVFDNQLATISVKTNEDGVAEARFHALVSSTKVKILASSPLAAGQARFVVIVQSPPEVAAEE